MLKRDRKWLLFLAGYRFDRWTAPQSYQPDLGVGGFSFGPRLRLGL